MAKVCATPGCPTLVSAGSYRGRCAPCNRAADQERGSREQRGYDYQHRTTRAAYVSLLEAGGEVLCWRCGLPITDSADLHLGHDDDDRTITRGPEHGRACNLSSAGRKGGG